MDSAATGHIETHASQAVQRSGSMYGCLIVPTLAKPIASASQASVQLSHAT